jgi:hypothetical protein
MLQKVDLPVHDKSAGDHNRSYDELRNGNHFAQGQSFHLMLVFAFNAVTGLKADNTKAG